MTAEPSMGTAAVESGHVDPDRFDHEAHACLAWPYLERLPVMGALRQ